MCKVCIERDNEKLRAHARRWKDAAKRLWRSECFWFEQYGRLELRIRTLEADLAEARARVV